MYVYTYIYIYIYSYSTIPVSNYNSKEVALRLMLLKQISWEKSNVDLFKTHAFTFSSRLSIPKVPFSFC